MFRKLLTTAAVAALLTGTAIAQQTPAPATPAPDAAAAPVIRADGLLASNIIGESVYNGTGDNAQNIGDVNDIVLDANGAVKSLIVGVGGFLGVGEKNVEVDYKTAQWAERNGDRWIVVATTKEQLESQPAFDAAPYAPALAPAAPAATGATVDPTPPPASAPQNEQPKPAN